MRLFIKSFHESSHKEWNVFMWVLDTLYSLLGNWLRDHTSWALSGIGVKIKSFLKCFFLQFLNFTALRYTVLFSYSKIYIAYVIYYEWSRSIIFPLCTCIFPSSVLWSNTVGATPTWESRQGLQKDENRALKWQSDEKISWEGVKIGKIGFRAASIRTWARVYIRKDSTCVRRLNHVSV